MWPFPDIMAARPDLDYSLHLLGNYGNCGVDPEVILPRPYVYQHLPRARTRGEVWLLRSWNTPWLVAAGYCARLRRIPLMLWHEAPGKTYDTTSWRSKARILVREISMPQIFRPYRGCVMLGIGELAIRRFAELAPRSRVSLLPYPNPQADALLAFPGDGQVRVHRGTLQLLFVGELSHRKAVDVLAAACERLWNEGFVFNVNYAGDGPMEQFLRVHAERSGGRAALLGHLSGEALLDLYLSADGFVLPSRWDGWGLPVHEALAAGLPVVVSDMCGAKMLCDGCGRVVSAGDVTSLVEGLRWCLSLSPEERRTIAIRGRAAASAITMDKVADALVRHAREALVLSI
jgi:glycosyltransferase involved in cell wall biosynthesis